MSTESEVAGKFVFHRKGGLKVYDETGKAAEHRKGPPAGKELKKVGEMTVNFYQGSCWIEICRDGVCEWYFWPGPGCPV